MNFRFKNIKKYLSLFLAVLILLGNSSRALALTPPSAPTPPPAPTAPPSAPTPPPSDPTPPPAMTPPPAATPTPTPKPSVQPSVSPSVSPTPLPSSISSPTPLPSPEGSSTTNASNANSDIQPSFNSEKSGGQDLDGGSGNNSLTTGDATSDGTIVNSVNSNLSSSAPSGVESASIVNSNNGSDSTNNGSAVVTNNNSVDQNNSAQVVNNLNQSAITGDNSVSKNTGGDVSITTGDANVSGTIINAINTNVAGISVAEFNVIDDHTGDIVLDFASACPTNGCGGSNYLANQSNGSGSTNTNSLEVNNNNTTNQTNTATIENNMNLIANSGSNEADKNTNGNSAITTGDANVAANLLTFANNNIAGGVVYGVVNIFGDLIGDIIFPKDAYYICCEAGDTTLANIGNGSDSNNSVNYDQNNYDSVNQFNIANIDNNLLIDANTGKNDVSKNTNGDSSVITGDSNVNASILNIANNNIIGGNWWLVIVNEAGKWVGKIMGSPQGSNIAGSDGFEFQVDENGEVYVANTGNGEGSTNNATLTENNNNTINQSNDARVVNNVNLTANTGNNSANKNTGGDSSIVTGDANVVANIVNFVNNNIAGTGKLFITVVNVFGNWMGDFVGPDSHKEPAIGGNTAVNEQNTTTNNSNNGNSSSNSDSGSGENVLAFSAANKKLNNGAGVVLGKFTEKFAGEVVNKKVQDIGSTVQEAGNAAKKTLNINLAWALVILVPLGVLTMIARRRNLILKAIKRNG